MKEARLILVNENAYHALAIKIATRTLVDAFGGVTVSHANGSWTDSRGNVQEEAVKIVDVAYVQSDDNDAKLYDIANAYRENAKQKEVYLRYGNGHVQLISAKSCMDNGHGGFDLSFGGMIEAMNVLVDTGKSREDRLDAFEYLESSLTSKKAA